MTFGRYEILGCTVKYWREKIDPVTGKPVMKKNKKTGEMEEVKVPSFVRYIYFHIPGTAVVFRFTSNKRNRWSDSRDKSTDRGAVKAVSYTDDTLRAELARMTSVDCAGRIMDEVSTVELTRTEYADLIGAEIVDIPMDDGSSKSVMRGGLPAMIDAETARIKAKVALDKQVNR